MRYKTIEGMRQTRLWITGVIVPAAYILYKVDHDHPGLKYQLADKAKRDFENMKSNFIDRFNKLRGSN